MHLYHDGKTTLFSAQTVAAIHGRSLPSITVYTNEMMTKLGQVGKDVFELPLEMNQIFLAEDICRREGLMFIDKDGNIKDFSSLSIN